MLTNRIVKTRGRQKYNGSKIKILTPLLNLMIECFAMQLSYYYHIFIRVLNPLRWRPTQFDTRGRVRPAGVQTLRTLPSIEGLSATIRPLTLLLFRCDLKNEKALNDGDGTLKWLLISNWIGTRLYSRHFKSVNLFISNNLEEYEICMAAILLIWISNTVYLQRIISYNLSTEY